MFLRKWNPVQPIGSRVHIIFWAFQRNDARVTSPVLHLQESSCRNKVLQVNIVVFVLFSTTLSWPSFSSDFIRPCNTKYDCFISTGYIFICSLRCLQEKPVQELIKAQETIEVRWLFFTYSFLHRQMKVTEPTIECQRSELRRQKWCILLTMSKYLNSPERPCDNDNLVHPNDRRGPESPTVGAKRS